MNGDIRRYLYTIGTILGFFFLLSIFFNIMPFVLLIGVIVYAGLKIVGFVKEKNKRKKFNDYKQHDGNEYTYKESSDDYTTGEIIDVEYEEVGNKKK